jgi:hypothetical protein
VIENKFFEMGDNSSINNSMKMFLSSPSEQGLDELRASYSKSIWDTLRISSGVQNQPKKIQVALPRVLSKDEFMLHLASTVETISEFPGNPRPNELCVRKELIPSFLDRHGALLYELHCKANNESRYAETALQNRVERGYAGPPRGFDLKLEYQILDMIVNDEKIQGYRNGRAKRDNIRPEEIIVPDHIGRNYMLSFPRVDMIASELNKNPPARQIITTILDKRDGSSRVFDGHHGILLAERIVELETFEEFDKIFKERALRLVSEIAYNDNISSETLRQAHIPILTEEECAGFIYGGDYEQHFEKPFKLKPLNSITRTTDFAGVGQVLVTYLNVFRIITETTQQFGLIFKAPESLSLSKMFLNYEKQNLAFIKSLRLEAVNKVRELSLNKEDEKRDLKKLNLEIDKTEFEMHESLTSLRSRIFRMLAPILQSYFILNNDNPKLSDLYYLDISISGACIAKFIYVVKDDETIPIARERLKSGGQIGVRPTHSQTANGESVYGAGEVIIGAHFEKFTSFLAWHAFDAQLMSQPNTSDGHSAVWELFEINNLSGHYQPGGSESLSYVKSLILPAIQQVGVIVDNVRVENRLLPGFKFSAPSVLRA